MCIAQAGHWLQLVTYIASALLLQQLCAGEDCTVFTMAIFVCVCVRLKPCEEMSTLRGNR